MSARLRPRFEYVAPWPVQAAPERLRAALEQPGAPCRGRVYGGHAVLYVLHDQERVWSPFLSLDLVGHGEGTLVRGLFGPKPSIWSLFVAAYAASGFGAVFAAGFAFAQWTLGQPPWGLWLFVASGLGAIATYAFARYGQTRGRGQMDVLRGVVDDALAAP
ncbi:MAG: hypothetical protein AAF845_18265 [Bacteroidota bacterium]